MALDKIHISNQIVCLEVTDGQHVAMDAAAYLRAAVDLGARAIEGLMAQVPLRLDETRSFPSGLVQLRYTVAQG